MDTQVNTKGKKVVLLTGASKGIGRALTEKLLEQGYYVIGTCRSGKIEGLKPDNLSVIPLDLADSESIKAAHQILFDRFEGIDILINNAGVGPDLGTEKLDEVSFQQTFDVNVKGQVFFTEALIDFVRDNGMILNISSKMGSLACCNRKGSIAYSMSKSAFNMYSKILANRVQKGIRVAIIHPGWVQTAINKNNVHAPLTPKESAERIFSFMVSDFENGAYWDVQDGKDLPW
ncbi:MAG: SDR family NAD(P)-dependent oxidoreductase [Chitinophagales bacterium]